jgi:hypothetical protein
MSPRASACFRRWHIMLGSPMRLALEKVRVDLKSKSESTPDKQSPGSAFQRDSTEWAAG